VPTPAIEQAFNIAERLLDRRPDRLEVFRPAVGGDDTHSFRLWIRSDPMLLQVKKRAGSPFGVYFHNRLRCRAITVPDLVAFDGAAGPEGEACAIWEWVDGQPAKWGPGQPCPYDEAEFGKLLRRIHDLPGGIPFGLLGDDPTNRPAAWPNCPDLGRVSDTWAGWFGCDLAAKRYFDKGYLTTAEADTLSSLPQRLRPLLDAAQPRLLHNGDIMHNGNLIIDPLTRRIVAVIDFADSMVGDPRWELAWVDYYFRQYPFNSPAFDMDRFRSGYGTCHDPDDPLGRFYLLGILLFEKLLFFDPSSSRGRWAVEKVKEILGWFARA
jgi:hypothetical protein